MHTIGSRRALHAQTVFAVRALYAHSVPSVMAMRRHIQVGLPNSKRNFREIDLGKCGGHAPGSKHRMAHGGRRTFTSHDPAGGQVSLKLGPSTNFRPLDPMEEVLVRPGPPVLPLLGPMPGEEVVQSAILYYQDPVPKELLQYAKVQEGRVYGAKLYSKDTGQQIQVAVPTGKPEDYVSGKLLIYSSHHDCKAVLHSANQHMGYNKIAPSKGLMDRMLVNVVRSDGTAVTAYFYFSPSPPDLPDAVQILTSSYDELCDRLREINVLGGVSGLLGWDEQVMMPQGAAALRAKQSSALAGVLYEKSTDKELGKLISRLKHQSLADAWKEAVVRDAARDYKKATALSKDLAQRTAELQSEGYQAWVVARKDNNFPSFAPVLKKWVSLTKETSAAIDKTKDPYDVAVDGFERGMSSDRLDQIFHQLKAGLVPLLQELDQKGKAPDSSWLKEGSFDVDVQAKLCKEIALNLGFDLDKGRLDVSVHPFTGGAGPSDVRMTTRFKEHDLTEGITGAIHETGHALYEQGRNSKYECLPVSDALSMGVHESQSLLWERCVALSLPFAHYLLPKLQAAFPQLNRSKTPHDLYVALNKISTDRLIRVEADEVTYPLHILLRYELESGLIRGKIKVDDLPDLWRKKMHSYLGVHPPSDAQGVLQDVHWPSGAFGYFPSYSLGAMMAVQIYQAAHQAMPTLEQDIAKGNFKPLREWLRVNIHQKGSLYPSADELLTHATGQPLKPEIFLAYLRKKYSHIYKLTKA
eukprot:g23630.t1